VGVWLDLRPEILRELTSEDRLRPLVRCVPEWFRLATAPPPYIPAILLGRMDVSETLHDSKIGTSLVRDAILRTISTSLHVGIRLMSWTP
jgi:hypothetical protein